MPKTIYITHCGREKIDPPNGAPWRFAVDDLHTGKMFRKFIARCFRQRVEWAILCDGHGIVLPAERIEWYDRAPKDLTDQERQNFVLQLAFKLPVEADVVFYGNVSGSRFAKAHEDILQRAMSIMGTRLRTITHLADII